MLQLNLSFVLFITLCLILSGCGSLKQRGQMNAFDYQTRAYGKMLRWGLFDQAAEMRQAKEGSLDPAALDKLEEIRVTSYRIVRSKVSPDANEAVVFATIDYYHERQNEIRTLNEQQLWWYDEEQGKWFLDGDLPNFLL